MSISASMVKELRERTGAGMMECKKALVESGGDMDAAAELLRKSGQAKADKKSGRVAADGRVVIKTNGSKAVVVEVNSETDFVAKDENFVSFAESVADTALASGTTDVETLSGEALADGSTVESARTDLIAKIGENISVRRVATVESSGSLGHYTHGAKIGAVVALEGGDEELARDIAMHVAAYSPQWVTRDEVPEEVLDEQRQLFAAQARNEGKPAEIAEKIVEGRLNSFYQDTVLLDQTFVNPEKFEGTVGQMIEQMAATMGENIGVRRFVRISIGES